MRYDSRGMINHEWTLIRSFKNEMRHDSRGVIKGEWILRRNKTKRVSV